MAIIPGTTPTITFSLPEGTDISDAEHIYISLKAGNASLIKTEDDILLTQGRIMQIAFTQEETLLFANGSKVFCQCNWTYADGTRGASDKASFIFGDQMIRRVLPDE